MARKIPKDITKRGPKKPPKPASKHEREMRKLLEGGRKLDRELKELKRRNSLKPREFMEQVVRDWSGPGDGPRQMPRTRDQKPTAPAKKPKRTPRPPRKKGDWSPLPDGRRRRTRTA